MKKTILMLEDDDDDRFITQSAFDQYGSGVALEFVSNSNDMFRYLAAAGAGTAAFPSMILLEHNAFPLDALAILKKIKSDPQLNHIPVIVLGAAMPADLIRQCYVAGAVSVILKPFSHREIDPKISTFIRYWFGTAALV